MLAPAMRIALAQTRPIKGDIAGNTAAHLELVERAVRHRAEVVVFPELSLTGYEPELARGLALGLDDPRLDEFQRISDASPLTIAVGAPTSTHSRPRISLLIFQPGRARHWITEAPRVEEPVASTRSAGK